MANVKVSADKQMNAGTNRWVKKNKVLQLGTELPNTHNNSY